MKAMNLTKWKSFNELGVMCRIGGGLAEANLLVIWPPLCFLEPVTKGWHSGTEMSDHEMWKSWTSTLYYFVNEISLMHYVLVRCLHPVMSTESTCCASWNSMYWTTDFPKTCACS